MIGFSAGDPWGSKTRVEWWEKATSHFSSKFQSTVVYLFYDLLDSHAKQSDVKQSEKENVAPAMLFDIRPISLLEVLIAAVYFFAFLFLDAPNFLFRALACGLSLRFSMAVL